MQLFAIFVDGDYSVVYALASGWDALDRVCWLLDSYGVDYDYRKL